MVLKSLVILVCLAGIGYSVLGFACLISIKVIKIQFWAIYIVFGYLRGSILFIRFWEFFTVLFYGF